MKQGAFGLYYYSALSNKEVMILAVVVVGENEPFEKVLRKFKRMVEQEGILTEVKRREFYEKPSQKKKRKERAMRKRLLKALKKKKNML